MFFVPIFHVPHTHHHCSGKVFNCVATFMPNAKSCNFILLYISTCTVSSVYIACACSAIVGWLAAAGHGTLINFCRHSVTSCCCSSANILCTCTCGGCSHTLQLKLALHPPTTRGWVCLRSHMIVQYKSIVLQTNTEYLNIDVANCHMHPGRTP